MNKEILDQLPADEQLVAEKLNSVSENMKLPQNFQWKLESQLMDAHQNKLQPTKGWFSKLIVPVSWAAVAVLGFFLLSWTIRSLVPPEQVNVGASNTDVPVETFESMVRQGMICDGPLAVEHGFAVSLTNQDKTGFITLDKEKAISELRSMIWSPDGEQLAILGNTTGNGNIYLTDSSGTSLYPVLTNPELGYLVYFDWSHDGRQFIAWSLDHQGKFFMFNADGTGLIEKPLNVQVLDSPRFNSDGSSIVFYGATSTSSGLFELMFTDSEAALINSSVQSATSYAFSPDGNHLAYMEYDRDLGEARLYSEDRTTRKLTLLGTLPIPKGSGSSLPDVANLGWSQDGTKLIFEFGRNPANRAVYLAYADGTGMVKVVDAAYAPSISADGNCLAYINNKQIFILDLNNVSLTYNSATPFLLADLPVQRGTTDFRLNKLQWSP